MRDAEYMYTKLLVLVWTAAKISAPVVRDLDWRWPSSVSPQLRGDCSPLRSAAMKSE